MHHAAWHGQLAVLKMLLSSGAHVNLRNHKVSFIRQLCCLSGHVLSSSACWVNEISIGSISLYNCALQGQTPLHWAARRGYASVVKELIAAGADVNATDNQVSILTVPLLPPASTSLLLCSCCDHHSPCASYCKSITDQVLLAFAT